MRLVTRDAPIVHLFADCAAFGVQAARLLGQVLGTRSGPERSDLAARLSEVEREADARTHEVTRRLNSTFVPPFDRSDIYALAMHLDDCVDAMETVGARVLSYQIDELPDAFLEQAALVQRQAELTAAAASRLQAIRSLADYWVEVNRLENDVERIHRQVLTDLFMPAPPGLVLVDEPERWAVTCALMDVGSHLAAAAKAYERVAHTIELMAVKEA